MEEQTVQKNEKLIVLTKQIGAAVGIASVLVLAAYEVVLTRQREEANRPPFQYQERTSLSAITLPKVPKLTEENSLR